MEPNMVWCWWHLEDEYESVEANCSHHCITIWKWIQCFLYVYFYRSYRANYNWTMFGRAMDYAEEHAI